MKSNKPKKDKRLHNTRVLLHAMGGGLRAHIEQSVMSVEDLELLEESLECAALMRDRDPKVYSESFVASKTRTELLLVNAERLFAAWENSSKSGAHRLRRRIIHEWYFNKQELPEIAMKYNRTEKTVLTQLGVALDELSVYFFGNDGLNIETATRKQRPIPQRNCSLDECRAFYLSEERTTH